MPIAKCATHKKQTNESTLKPPCTRPRNNVGRCINFNCAELLLAFDLCSLITTEMYKLFFIAFVHLFAFSNVISTTSLVYKCNNRTSIKSIIKCNLIGQNSSANTIEPNANKHVNNDVVLNIATHGNKRTQTQCKHQWNQHAYSYMYN